MSRSLSWIYILYDFTTIVYIWVYEAKKSIDLGLSIVAEVPSSFSKICTIKNLNNG